MTWSLRLVSLYWRNQTCHWTWSSSILNDVVVNVTCVVDKSLPEESVFRGLLEEVTDPESRELWSGDGYRRYKRSRNRNKSSSSRSSRKGRRSRSRNRDTKLVIIKDDNSRSTSNCVDDIEYWFEDDFDDVDITRSDRNARSGDIVVIVDGDVDCDDLR